MKDKRIGTWTNPQIGQPKGQTLCRDATTDLKMKSFLPFLCAVLEFRSRLRQQHRENNANAKNARTEHVMTEHEAFIEGIKTPEQNTAEPNTSKPDSPEWDALEPNSQNQNTRTGYVGT